MELYHRSPIRVHGVIFNQAQAHFMAWYLIKYRDNFPFTLLYLIGYVMRFYLSYVHSQIHSH